MGRNHFDRGRDHGALAVAIPRAGVLPAPAPGHFGRSENNEPTRYVPGVAS